MAKARKLPSGNWSCQVYSHTETTDGEQKRIYQRFTAATKKEAEYQAAEFIFNKNRRKNPANIATKEAIQGYIDAKRGALSPSTIRAYASLLKYHYDEVDIPISKLNSEILQRYFNKKAESLSAKTLRNMSGLLSAAIHYHSPDFQYFINLPKNEREEILIPEESDLVKTLKSAENMDIFLPILLASGMGLRRSEIAGLCAGDVNSSDNTLSVTRAMVYNEDVSQWVYKTTKTTAGKRILSIPPYIAPYVLKSLENKGGDESLTGLTPTDITNKFFRLLETEKIPHMRFHDLRHYYASMMLANNVPNKYAVKRMGHATDDMLKRVYQHTLKEKDKEVTTTIDNYLDGVFGETVQQCNTKCNTKK